MSRPTLTFGIEIECSVATLQARQTHPDPRETRVAHFAKAPYETDALNLPGTSNADVAHHIRATLAAAGLKVRPSLDPSSKDKDGAWFGPWPELPDFTVWDVGHDVSIHGPKVPHSYDAVGVEIRTPAFFFTPEALQEVVFALGVLSSTYLLAVNDTTGLHVHVGNGWDSFSFDTVRRLMAFLFAFEPQLSSLHPRDRYNNTWASSLRSGSRYSQGFLDKNGRRPRALEGMAHFLKSKDWHQLVDDCEASGYSRLAYRFPDLQYHDEGVRDPRHKLTVEFRQHAGSVDAEEICNWVRTTVGIVGFIIDSDIRALKDLFSLVHHETPNNRRGETVEPVLAETEFTIVDLLRHMDLVIPAMYYQKQGMYKIRKDPESEHEMFRYSTRASTNAGDTLCVPMNPAMERQLRVEMEAQQRAFQTPVPSDFQHDPYDTYGVQSKAWQSPISKPEPSHAVSRAQTDNAGQERKWPHDTQSPISIPDRTHRGPRARTDNVGQEHKWPHDTLKRLADAIVEANEQRHSSWKGKGVAHPQAQVPPSSFLTEDMQDITDALSSRSAESKHMEDSQHAGDTSEPPSLRGFFGTPPDSSASGLALEKEAAGQRSAEYQDERQRS